MATLSELMRDLERLRHSRAVWMETLEHLAQFLDKDTIKADRGIRAEGCSVNPVPQAVVREFVSYINQQEIAPLNQQIDTIENLNIMETSNDQNDPQGKDSPRSKNTAPEAKPGPKIGSIGKTIRAIPKSTGGKASGIC